MDVRFWRRWRAAPGAEAPKPTRLLAAVALIAGIAAAQPAGAEGLINAVSYRPVPADASIHVQALNDSEDALAVRDAFAGQLADAGYTLASRTEARMVLTVEIHDVAASWAPRDRRTVLEMHARGGDEGGEDAQVRLNLYDTGRGGLFNEGPGVTRSEATRYRVEATLDDAREKRRLWDGWAVADLERSDALALLVGMVPVLVENLGQTVRREPFPIP